MPRALVVIVLVSCGGDAVPTPDAAPGAVASIAQALDCGAGPPSGPGNSNQLLRHAIDVGRFPDALCNDGSGAVFYYRPYAGEENRDRWLINLNGGGSCATGQSCADRWCWCRSKEGPDGCPFAGNTTSFSMENMNADDRASLAGSGITLRGDPQRPNPIGGYNQVRVIYCSSDTWNGTRRAVPLDAVHPKTGAAVRYAIHFLGARILDAAIATLRGDGVARPGTLPDLDDAEIVILSGDSGGGAGVINNLDRVAALLPGAQVRGLIDAIVGPDLSRLDFAGSLPAAEGVDTYAKYVAYLKTVPDANQGAQVDRSCAERHAADDAVCSDISHVVRHHVTTPFFVRMALLDSLISSGYVDAMFSDPQLGVLTVPKFGQILQRELAAFPMLPQTAEEGGAMAVAPGVFAPACFKHDTLHDDEEVYEVTIAPAGTPLSLFDVFGPWLLGGAGPTAVLTQSMTRADTVCQD